mmetsp:Transcript_2783/g.9085  ORF Transcript_2783/g.9085 Transcript_2783/m.9085 type:complete len:222 (+) Transcript_2783:1453-2118(+)
MIKQRLDGGEINDAKVFLQRVLFNKFGRTRMHVHKPPASDRLHRERLFDRIHGERLGARRDALLKLTVIIHQRILKPNGVGETTNHDPERRGHIRRAMRRVEPIRAVPFVVRHAVRRRPSRRLDLFERRNQIPVLHRERRPTASITRLKSSLKTRLGRNHRRIRTRNTHMVLDRDRRAFQIRVRERVVFNVYVIVARERVHTLRRPIDAGDELARWRDVGG